MTSKEIYTHTGDNTIISLIVDVDITGDPVWHNYHVGITGYDSNSEMQLDVSQTLGRIVRIPVRRREQFLQFAIDWPLQTAHSNTSNKYNYNGFKELQDFQNDIRRHQLYTIKSLRPAPMKFVFTNNSDGKNSIINNNIPGSNARQYNGPSPVNNVLQSIEVQGWIVSITKEYDRFKSLYTTQYAMNILTPKPTNSLSHYRNGTNYDYNGQKSVLAVYSTPPSADSIDGTLNWTSDVTYNPLGIDIQKIGN